MSWPDIKLTPHTKKLNLGELLTTISLQVQTVADKLQETEADLGVQKAAVEDREAQLNMAHHHIQVRSTCTLFQIFAGIPFFLLL